MVVLVGQSRNGGYLLREGISLDVGNREAEIEGFGFLG